MSYSKKYQELKEKYESILNSKQYPVHKWLAFKDLQDEVRALIPETLDMNIRKDLATLCVDCEKQIKDLSTRLKWK